MFLPFKFALYECVKNPHVKYLLPWYIKNTLKKAYMISQFKELSYQYHSNYQKKLNVLFPRYTIICIFRFRNNLIIV